jgi:hypothetical protein
MMLYRIYHLLELVYAYGRNYEVREAHNQNLAYNLLPLFAPVYYILDLTKFYNTNIF